ncbi:DUF4382 domain-containing protein [Ramlibacter henchirensis]|nr:DUF4382 domain-containing protein [Ramlibacter henchirensis]
MKNWNPLTRAATVAASLLLAACGGGGGGDAPQGTLRMALTDAPSCGYDHVYVTVERVRVHQSDGAGEGEGGWREIVLSQPKRLDLLELTNGVLEELGQTSLPAGTYNQVRLVLAENRGNTPLANAVQLTGASSAVPLRTPSAQQSGLKLKTKFEVAADGLADLVLDFDACRSIVKAGTSGDYNLKPVLRVAERKYAGIQGYVSTTLAMSGTRVSAQQNGVVLRSTVPDATGKFVLPFLPAGNYDVVIASEGRSTAVVSSVPVTATTTLVNGTATAILPPVATTLRDVTGTASVGSGTTTLVIDAEVRATQALAGGPTIEVGVTPVDAVSATYTLRLPAAAPVKAAYAATGALSFAADNAVAGRYRLLATAPNRTEVGRDADVSTANQVVDFSFAP